MMLTTGRFKAVMVQREGYLLELAHQKSLRVHTWRLRNDASGFGFRNARAEMEYYTRLGVDRVFTDFLATGVVPSNAIRWPASGPHALIRQEI